MQRPQLLNDPAYALDQVALAQAVFDNPEHVRERRRRFLKIALVVAFGLLATLFIWSLVADWHFDQVWRYETAGLLGASVGTAELLSRYRDAPSFVLISLPGIGYILINAAASLAAMGVISAFDWKFGATGNGVAPTQVLMAGFGAMALFRSSLLTVKAGNDDVGIGPSSVLSIMMAASDRSADRLRAAERAGRVHDIMSDVSYEKARDQLPTVAIALMQNLSPADEAALNADLDRLKSSTLPEKAKALLLGLKITNVVSTAVLSASKRSLDESILVDPERATNKTKANGDEPAEQTAQAQALAENRTAEKLSAASKGLPQTPQTPDPSDERSTPR
jgi:hypothetical protein